MHPFTGLTSVLACFPLHVFPYYHFITPKVIMGQPNFRDKFDFISYYNIYVRSKFKCIYVSVYYWDCTKLQCEPLSFSVKHTFPLSALSFPRLHVSAVSLLSKKGLRYLLYPFISLWMVGGRISPSFTSALSKELSNNLRAKTESERGREKQK